MSQAMFHKENEIMKSSNSKTQRSVTMNTTPSNILTIEHKYRSNSFSNSIGQKFIGFLQRKFSQKNDDDEDDDDDDDKQGFDDLTKMK
jgi:hypothetical protein